MFGAVASATCSWRATGCRSSQGDGSQFFLVDLAPVVVRFLDFVAVLFVENFTRTMVVPFENLATCEDWSIAIPEAHVVSPHPLLAGIWLSSVYSCIHRSRH